MAELNELLQEINLHLKQQPYSGKVADYIPELADIARDQFAFSVFSLQGEAAHIGQTDTYFSIQSISKVFALTRALEIYGDSLWQRLGREPSGTPFNSLVQLERENGIPRNPFINAGALVICDHLYSHDKNILDDIQKLLSTLSGDKNIRVNERVLRSEWQSGYRNAALANFLASFANLNNPVSEILNLYYQLCSFEASTAGLAQSMLFLANHGVCPRSGKRIIQSNHAKYINALMLTCGTYDEVGNFAYRVGLPAKSGVGGGIVAVLPGKYGLCTWSPGLNDRGNSIRGAQALEYFTSLSNLSVF
jgi:glutaminase